MDTIWIVGILVLFAGMTFLNSRKQKASQQAALEKKSQIVKGQKVMTTSGLIGIVESNDGVEIVINSEGSKSRWLIDAVNVKEDAAEIAADDARTSGSANDARTSGSAGDGNTPTKGQADDAIAPKKVAAAKKPAAKTAAKKTATAKKPVAKKVSK